MATTAGGPPPRPAPIPPGLAGGIEEAVAQLRAALEKDPTGVTTDENTRMILEKLNDEIARMSGDMGEDGEGYYEDEVGGEGEEGGETSPSAARRGPRVELRKGPRPIDLWKAAHEGDGDKKETTVLTLTEWNSLVDRLNESSKRKQAYLMRAQHAQIAAELAGLTFTPHISEKSRELAAHNKSLPQRMEALMRKKKAKLEKIRHDRVQKEMAEATFRPDLEKSRASVKMTGLAGAAAVRERRQLGHLLQYELDKRIRAAQRRQFIAEMEDKELTFNPAINKNSARIVQRLNKEREEREKAAALAAVAAGGEGGGVVATLDSPTTTRAAKKALTAALAAGVPLEMAAAVTGLPLPDTKVLKSLGRSYLPGHEEETFHPKINPRSAALYRPGMDDKDVYSRLYTASTAARNSKARSKSPSYTMRGPAVSATRPTTSSRTSPTKSATRGGGDDGAGDVSSVGSKEYLRDAAGYPVDEDGEPAPGHPHYFNLIAYDTTTKVDFLLRRLLPLASLTTGAGVGDTSIVGGR